MSKLEKGLFIRQGHAGSLNFVKDKWQDEETGKYVYQFLLPCKFYDGKSNEDSEILEVDEDLDINDARLNIKKYSNDIYGIIQRKDILYIFIDDEDYITQVIEENKELVVYVKTKRYTLEDLKEIDAISEITSKFYAFNDNSLSLEDVEYYQRFM